MNRMLVVCIFAAVAIVMLLHQCKEGFQDSNIDSISPDEFAFNLVQAVKGPIKRLSSTLLDLPTWKERIALASMTPVELARHQMRKQSPQ
jgi:hypothetical protein